MPKLRAAKIKGSTVIN